MAFDVSSQRSSTTISQINVTPLVDVMLVLLVIFMVTAPIIQQGVQVNLPQAKAGPVAGAEDPLVVTIAKNGRVYLNDNVVTVDELSERLRAVKKIKADKEVYLRRSEERRVGKERRSRWS